ncbi:MAG: FAD-dependent oxidoreductase [Candidatus Eremiobacteraeota bacterium]|nr:FAD-dependent oxidoreductase [Candidatus Eremiobacteraeota bacterium]
MQEEHQISKTRISILGGGIAGLSAAWYAAKKGLTFTLFEEKGAVGGNCITFRHGDFRFDSGAHRFLDEYADVTADVKALMGRELHSIEVPSRIFEGGKFIDIPFKPANLIRNLGMGTFMKASTEIMKERLTRGRPFESFHDFAVRTYGNTLASRFLLNYTEKLWGRPTSLLSPVISGKRLQGLSVWNIVTEALLGPLVKKTHREGAFYYPEGGIHQLSLRLGEAAGSEHIRLHSRVTALFHHDNRVTAIEVNGKERHDVDKVVSTLPLDYLVKIMSPALPDPIPALARRLSFRHLRIVCFFLARPSVMNVATLYVPDRRFTFNRLYEPRNRNASMAPEGRTSLAAEICCDEGDELWNMDDEPFIGKIRGEVLATGLIEEKDITGAATERLTHAYPVLLVNTPSEVREITTYLEKFQNLKLSGRPGRFEYSWIHDMLRAGMALAEESAGSLPH